MEFQRESGDTIFTPRTRLNELLSEIKGDKTDLIVAKKMAEKSNSSYIFGANSREIFLKDYQGKFQQYSFNLNYICLFDYLFISSQMSAKPYFIGSTGILLLW